MWPLLFFLICFPGVHVNVDGVQICGANRSHHTSRRWWPASTVKLFVSVAAWEVIHQKTKSASIKKTVKKHIYQALAHSSNRSFDRLVDLLGRDRLTRWLLDSGYSITWISVPYSRSGRFPGKLLHGTCKSTCTSMSELQRVLRYSLRYPFIKESLRRPGLGPGIYGKSGYVRRYHFVMNLYIRGVFLTLAIPARKSYAIMRRKLYKFIRRL